MRRSIEVVTLVCGLALCGCVIKTSATPPQVVENASDTFRFRIFPNAVVMESTAADRAADQEIGKFRVANGYASSRIVARDKQGSAFVYTVQFVR